MQISGETIFRSLFLVFTLAFLVIRNGYTWRIRRRQRANTVRERFSSQLFGGLIITVGWFFSAAYLIAPGWPAWAYCGCYPLWLRVMGALIMGAGVALFAWTHRHLGPNYHARVAISTEQALVTTGPYRWTRHPMYMASLLYDLGCGCLSANLVLTLVLPALLIIHVALRVGWEEQLLMEYFGAPYQAYTHETPRFFPHFRSVR